MKNILKISLITVVYNNKEFIESAIKSVLTQTYKDIEYIIIDGGSTDGTLNIINKYKVSKKVSEKDSGVYDALNKGIKLATGDIIGLLHSDDIFYDNKVIEDIVKNFDDNVDCTYGNLIYVDRNNIDNVKRNWISKKFENGLFEKSWTPAHPTFYCRREIFEKYGMYRLDFKIASDVELMYRFLQKEKIRSKFINRYMVKMRNAGISNRGLKSTYVITKEMRQAIKENGGKFNLFIYLFYKLLKTTQFIKKTQKIHLNCET